MGVTAEVSKPLSKRKLKKAQVDYVARHRQDLSVSHLKQMKTDAKRAPHIMGGGKKRRTEKKVSKAAYKMKLKSEKSKSKSSKDKY
jgi:hypothetical protein